MSAEARYASYSRRLIRIYIVVLMGFTLLATGNFLNQALSGTHSSFKSALVASLLLALCLAVVMLWRHLLYRRAVRLLIIGLVIAASTPLFLFGTGVRAPVIAILAAAIGLAHFQFGIRGGRLVTGITLLILCAGLFLESRGYIPGTGGERFPPTTNWFIMLSAAFTLTYLTALEMQSRADAALSELSDKNSALNAAIGQANRNRETQSQFFERTTPALLNECRQLADVCEALSRQDPSGRENPDPDLLRANALLLERAFSTSQRVVEQFEQAVAEVEKDIAHAPAPL